MVDEMGRGAPCSLGGGTKGHLWCTEFTVPLGHSDRKAEPQEESLGRNTHLAVLSTKAVCWNKMMSPGHSAETLTSHQCICLF